MYNHMPPMTFINFLDCVGYEIERSEYTLEHIENLRKLPYKEYLETDHWKKLRAAVLNKHGHICEICGAQGVEVHAHHKTYLNKGHEHINEIACYCAECHKEIHDIANQLPKKPKFNEITQEMLDNLNYNHKRFKVVKDYTRRTIGIDIVI